MAGTASTSLKGRWLNEDTRLWLRREARSPWFPLAALTLVFLVLALTTGPFSGLRALYATLPYRDADHLVACYQVHFLSASWGVQARYIRPWQANSKTLLSLAAYQVRSYQLTSPGFPARAIDGARVTEGFFDLLGVRTWLGRSFRPQDSFETDPVILSYGFWRTHFRPDTNAIGAELTLDGRPSRVIGVLPAGFWFRSRELSVWTLLPDLARLGPEDRLVGAVGRLRPGATTASARTELEEIAWRTSRFRGGALRVVPLAQSLRPALHFVFSAFFLGLALALGMALVQFWRSWRKLPHATVELLRYWGFFLAKTTLALTGLAVFCVEMAARNALALYPYKLFTSFLMDWSSLLGAMLIFRWSILDQSRRCPVCLRRLALPVSSGSWGSTLIEPPSTELLCDQGHGALCVAEGGATMGEIRRWIALDDSWKELFTAGRNQ